MLCFSPNFTHDDPDERARQVDRQKAAIDLSVRLGNPLLPHAHGPALPAREPRRRRALVGRVHHAIARVRREARRDPLPREPLQGRRLAVPGVRADGGRLPRGDRRGSIRRSFGVQYDPSNAVVGGFDPIAFLEKIKHRVVTMHASDRYLVPGTTIEEIRAADGTVGYPDKLQARRDGQGAERLRRNLPHPRGRRVRRLDLGRGRHERARRVGPLGRVPETAARPVLRSGAVGGIRAIVSPGSRSTQTPLTR